MKKSTEKKKKKLTVKDLKKIKGGMKQSRAYGTPVRAQGEDCGYTETTQFHES
jgi:hypothetical protein